MTPPLTAEQKATERMAQAYPTLAAFYSKYAIGSMTAPSCFGCGHVGERSTTHLELPDMYLCASCVAKIRGKQDVNANEKHGCHGGDGVFPYHNFPCQGISGLTAPQAPSWFPVYHAPTGEPNEYACRPAPPLTEERVREIIREELDKRRRGFTDALIAAADALSEPKP